MLEAFDVVGVLGGGLGMTPKRWRTQFLLATALFLAIGLYGLLSGIAGELPVLSIVAAGIFLVFALIAHSKIRDRPA